MSQKLDFSIVSKRQQYTALAVAAVTIITAGSFTTLAGLLTTRFVTDLGWQPASVAPGIALNMVLYGAVAPFAIHAMEKYGIKPVSIVALFLLTVGSLMSTIESSIVFNISWGIAVGVGCGSLTMAYGALVARVWFKDIGLATGVLTASAVLGQFILLPVWAYIAEEYGWQMTLIGCAFLAVTALIINLTLLTEKYTAVTTISKVKIPVRSGFGEVILILKEIVRSKSFWLIALVMAMCGATTNGLMWSSFTPAAVEADLDIASASFILLLVGIFNIPGTIFAGWLSDKVSPKLILAVVFAARGATFLWLPLILVSDLDWRLVSFGILFGIFDVATVPPVIALCNRIFGDKGPSVFSWINAFHQVGAGLMALLASGIHLLTGSYQSIWVIAAIVCFTAILVVYAENYYRKKEMLYQN